MASKYSGIRDTVSNRLSGRITPALGGDVGRYTVKGNTKNTCKSTRVTKADAEICFDCGHSKTEFCEPGCGVHTHTATCLLA